MFVRVALVVVAALAAVTSLVDIDVLKAAARGAALFITKDTNHTFSILLPPPSMSAGQNAASPDAFAECTAHFPGLRKPPLHVPAPPGPRVLGGERVVPRQGDIPVYVVTFNNPTFLRAMLRQVECYGTSAVVVDSGSTYPPMLQLLAALPQRPTRNGVAHRVIMVRENVGPRRIFTPELFAEMPDFVAITDSDIAFNPNLPPNFLEVMANVTQLYEGVPGLKVGFALNVSFPERFWPGAYGGYENVQQFELQRHWAKPAVITGVPLEMYFADTDSNFAVYDVANTRAGCNSPSVTTPGTCHFFAGVRMAGDFTAEHVPWTIDFTKGWDAAEVEAAYGQHSRHWSTISSKLAAKGVVP
jgi:hypothetical protein